MQKHHQYALDKGSISARLLNLSVITCAVFILLTITMKLQPEIFTVDPVGAKFITQLRSSGFDWAMVKITQLGDSTSLISISMMIIVLLLFEKLWKPALICGVGFLGSTLTVGLLKSFVQRARPLTDLYTGSESFSFPSGHMTNTTVVIGTLGIFLACTFQGVWRRLTIITTIALISCVGISRIYLGAHWPFDIIGGLLLGGTFVMCIQLLIRIYEPSVFQVISKRRAILMLVLAILIWGIHVATNTNLPIYNLMR